MQLKQASDHTLLVHRRYCRCIGPNYNSKDAVPIFHDSLSYYQHTDSCLYSTVCSRSISTWNSRAFLVRIFFPCNVKKNVKRTRLFTGHFENGRYAISIIATYFIEIKKCYFSAWNHGTAVWKVPRKKRIPNFRPNSIGGFAVSETKKPPSQKFP